MTRRALERTLETLTRAELRTLALELTEWLGPDAVARLLPDGPFERSAERPQLQLAAVDTGAASARLAHVRAAGLAAIRVSSSDLGRLGDALGEPAVREAIAAGVGTAVGDAVAAVRFDLRAGLDLTDEVLDTLARLRRATGAFESEWAFPDPDLDELLTAIAARVEGVALDEATFGVLLDVCRAADTAAHAPDPWRLVRAAVGGDRNPGAVRWVVRVLEHGAPAEAVMPLLSILADTADVEQLVQAAEIHLDHGAPVYALLVDALAARGRTAEARFWIGEGRLRHPDALAWARLEERIS